MLLFCWIFLAFSVIGFIGNHYGMHYLFLNPEYLGDVYFWSFALVGFTFGGFLMAWNITTYIINSHRFPFLATMERPFSKYCLNNSIIPITFMIFFVTSIVRFQWYNELAEEGNIFMQILGLFGGFIVSLLATAIYFEFTNKDALSYKKEGVLTHSVRKKDRIRIEENPYRDAWRVDNYITENFKIRLVRDVAHYDAEILLRVFRQNHSNALLIQVGSILLLILLGLLIDNPAFQIPAAASIFLFLAVLTTLLGALSFWLRGWRSFVFIILLVGINHLTSIRSLNYQNEAYGLNYSVEPARYGYGVLDSLASTKNQQDDLANTTAILENWKAKNKPKSMFEKPKAVFISVSGGGMRATVWAVKVLQEAQVITEGELFDNTILMTGASGGMLGAAYMREIYWQEQKGEEVNWSSTDHTDGMSQDMLNPILFTTVVNDIFVPWMKFKRGGYAYRKDRGYIFERQLSENSNGLLDKPISAYREAEYQSVIPMMYISPVEVDMGKQLMISPHGVSFMMQPEDGATYPYLTEHNAIDFGRFLREQDGYNLSMTTALRMNATYPLILPTTILPCEPYLEVMDAGWADNNGLATGFRFAQTFSDWLEKNTGGVIFVDIRSSEKSDEISEKRPQGILGKLTDPLGSISNMTHLQDYYQDTELSYLIDMFGKDKVHMVRFQYKPREINRYTSMSLHLTNREKRDVISAIQHDDNQESLRRLKDLLK